VAPVSAADPFGVGHKHRICRLLLRVGDATHKVCWALMERDGSASFGLSTDDLTFEKTGSAYLSGDGCLLSDSGIKLDALPLQHRRNPHVTLHPTGECHMRANDAPPILRVTYGAWYPVVAGFTWLQAYTAAVDLLPVVPKPSPRDAVVAFQSGFDSARIQVDLLPRESDASFPIDQGALHTLTGVGPGLTLRISIYSHSLVRSAIFILDPSGTTAKL